MKLACWIGVIFSAPALVLNSSTGRAANIEHAPRSAHRNTIFIAAIVRRYAVLDCTLYSVLPEGSVRFVLSVFVIFSSSICAQVTGRLTGSVVDPTGASVPKATVSLMLQGGKRPVLSTLTSSDGLFAIESIRPELYDVVVENSGFQSYKLQNVKIDPARSTDLAPIKLVLATTASAIEVKASAETVQTSSTDISTTVTMDQIRKLPVSDRDVLGFITTQAGVSNSQFETAINGQRSSFSNVTLDGVNIQDNYIRTGGLSYSPNQLFLDQ